MRLVVRSAPLLGAVLLLSTVAAPVRASEHPPLSTWPVVLRSGPIDLRDNDGPREPRGRWTARDVRLADGRLRFTLDVTPAEVDLPVKPGPAVLFVSVGASGGMGDVGYGRVLDVTPVVAPACRAEPCRYRFAVDADLTGLPAMVAAADIDPFVMADVGLSLARTFGDGTWIQVMDDFRADGRQTFRDGRPMTGWVRTTGLAPVRTADAWSKVAYGTTIDLAKRMDRLTAGLPDPSRPLETVRVRLAVDAPGCWPYLRVAIHDAQATRPLDAPLLALDPGGTVVEVPDGTTWSVTLHESGMVDDDSGYSLVSHAGTFTTAGEDMEVAARYTCGEEPDDIRTLLTSVPAVSPLPAPRAVRQGAWQPSLDRLKHRRRALPVTVATTDAGFTALSWDVDAGWTELASRDARTWSEPVPVSIEGLPEPDGSADPRLWSTDDGLLLTSVLTDAAGAATLATWRRDASGRWIPAGSVPVAGRSAVRQVASAAGTTLILVAPAIVDPDPDQAQVAPQGPTQLIRSDGSDGSDGSGGSGGWVVDASARGGIASIAATDGGFAAVRRAAAGGVDRLLTSADGVAWTEAGPLPTGSLVMPRLAATHDGLVLVASEADGMTQGWRQADDEGWIETLTALGPLVEHGLAASGDTIAVLTRVGTWEHFGAGAVSVDGGRTWDRGEAVDTVADTCQPSLAIRGRTVIGANGSCRSIPVINRWVPQR